MQKNRRLRWPNLTAVEHMERRAKAISAGVGWYKLLFILFVGSFLGVVVEMLWCLLENGTVEGRAGLVWGPFNLLYGVGAASMTVTLYPFRRRSLWMLLLGGMAVGTVVEYLCSWWQERTFGSRSWDYGHHPFNADGRVCLLFSVFWGILGIVWIKAIYPPLSLWLLRLPRRWLRVTALGISLFLAVNAIVTYAAVSRWSQRLANHAPSSRLEAVIDERFPNERMERLFNNMQFD